MPRIVLAVTLAAILFYWPPVRADVTVTHTYDELGRLTAVEYSDGTRINYVYDAAGNRISQTVTTASQGAATR